MKTLNINGKTLQYQTFWDCNEWGEYAWTEFYHGTQKVIKRTGFLGLFGPKVEVEEPIYIFKIDEDSDNTRLSKRWWLEKITKELELVDRKDQLERGELI